MTFAFLLVAQDATDPNALKRTQVNLKRLRHDLVMIDDEIELGDKTQEDKSKLQAQLADLTDSDKKQGTIPSTWLPMNTLPMDTPSNVYAPGKDT